MIKISRGHRFWPVRSSDCLWSCCLLLSPPRSCCSILNLAFTELGKITTAYKRLRCTRVPGSPHTGTEGKIKTHPRADGCWMEPMENTEQGRRPLDMAVSHRRILPQQQEGQLLPLITPLPHTGYSRCHTDRNRHVCRSDSLYWCQTPVKTNKHNDKQEMMRSSLLSVTFVSVYNLNDSQILFNLYSKKHHKTKHKWFNLINFSV